MHSTITSKGQITLPKALRIKLGLKPGDQVMFFPHGDGYELKKTISIHDLAGVFPKPEKTATLEEIDKAIRHHAVNRFLSSTEQ